MGGGSGGGGDTTTTQEPWEVAQPYLERGYARAEQDANRPQRFYEGRTYAELTPGQQRALGAMGARGRQGSEVGHAAQGNIANQQQGGGYANREMQRVLGGEYLRRMNAGDYAGGGQLGRTSGGDAIDRYLSGPGGSGGSLLNSVAGGDMLARYIHGTGSGGDLTRTARGSDVEGYLTGRADIGRLRDTAQGDFLNSNPYLDRTFESAARGVTDQFQKEIMPGINASFGSAGGTGGGIHQLYAGEAAGQATDSLADLSANIYGSNYQAERDRMMDASNTFQQGYLTERGLQNQAGSDRLAGYLAERGMQDQAGMARQQGYLTERGFQEGAANTQLGGYLAERGLQDAAAQEHGRQNLQGAALAPGLAGLDYQDLNARINAENPYQQQNQNKINEHMDRFNFYQQEPTRRAQNYLGMIQGLPSLPRTITEQQGGDRNRLMGGAGGAMTGAAVGSYFAPGVGTAVGAGIGGLAGLFGLI